MLGDLLNELESLQLIEPNIDEFERILGDIAKLNDSSCIKFLLSFLDDTSELDELMFSIIHTIELFEDTVYVKEIIRELVNLWKKSPRWAIIIHMRILNSPSTLLAYENEICFASDDRKITLQLICSKLTSRRPEFIERCIRILNKVKII